jgi:hypothetical protein
MANPFAADSSPIPPGDQPLSVANGVATPQWFRYWFSTGDQAKLAVSGLNSYGKNRVHNSVFQVNQRGWAPGAVGAGNFFLDRWKGGTAGATIAAVTGTQPDQSLSITAGTIQQTIEGLANEGGVFTLSWNGTALGIVQGMSAYQASPITFSTTVGTQYYIEFATGTVGRVQLEKGSIATPFAWTPYTADIAQCRRFLTILPTGTRGGNGAAGVIEYTPVAFPTQMRVVPTAVVHVAPVLVNCAAYTPAGLAVDGGVQFVTVVAAGPWAFLTGYMGFIAEI